MDSIPRIRIEMEGIRAGVIHHMGQHNDEFNDMVKDALDRTLTEEWVKASIQDAVNKTVQSAINGLGDNWELKQAVSNALGKALSRMVEGA
jgi:hypothetical protein